MNNLDLVSPQNLDFVSHCLNTLSSFKVFPVNNKFLLLFQNVANPSPQNYVASWNWS